MQRAIRFGLPVARQSHEHAVFTTSCLLWCGQLLGLMFAAPDLWLSSCDRLAFVIYRAARRHDLPVKE